MLAITHTYSTVRVIVLVCPPTSIRAGFLAQQQAREPASAIKQKPNNSHTREQRVHAKSRCGQNIFLLKTHAHCFLFIASIAPTCWALCLKIYFWYHEGIFIRIRCSLDFLMVVAWTLLIRPPGRGKGPRFRTYGPGRLPSVASGVNKREENRRLGTNASWETVWVFVCNNQQTKQNRKSHESFQFSASRRQYFLCSTSQQQDHHHPTNQQHQLQSHPLFYHPRHYYYHPHRYIPLPFWIIWTLMMILTKMTIIIFLYGGFPTYYHYYYKQHNSLTNKTQWSIL